MRGHHQEVHMVDDFLVGQHSALVTFRIDDLGEDVLGVGATPLGNFGAEIGVQIFAALHALAHLRERKRLPDRRHRRLHHVDEGGVHLVGLRTPGDAEKARRGEVERELLHLLVKQHLLRHFLDAAADPLLQLAEIVLHRARLEGDGERAAVIAMLFEVHQHQAVREQPFEHRHPALFGREDAVAVHQHHLVGVGADHLHAVAADVLVQIDIAHLVMTLLRQRERVEQEAVGPLQLVPNALLPFVGQMRELFEAGILESRIALRIGGTVVCAEFGRVDRPVHDVSSQLLSGT